MNKNKENKMTILDKLFININYSLETWFGLYTITLIDFRANKVKVDWDNTKLHIHFDLLSFKKDGRISSKWDWWFHYSLLRINTRIVRSHINDMPIKFIYNIDLLYVFKFKFSWQK